MSICPYLFYRDVCFQRADAYSDLPVLMFKSSLLWFPKAGFFLTLADAVAPLVSYKPVGREHDV